MITDLKPYAQYKKSGLPWLGQVPAHWDVSSLKGLASPKSIVNQTGRELLSVYLRRGVVRFADVDEKRTNATSQDLSRYQAVDPGDFVLNNQQAWRGSVGVSSVAGIVSPAYLVLALSDRYSSRYANLLFRDWCMVSQYLVCSKGVGSIQRNLYWPHLKRIGVIVPAPEEQAAIVRFLDWTNGRLGRAIQAKRKVIALLNEQKQAIIHRAVTRGLDPSVPLKPSGIPWLGDIPQHWDVRKLKYEMTFRGGGTPSKGNPGYWNGTIPWVSPKDMKSEVIHDAEDHITELAVVESSTNLVPAGSLLMVVRSGILQRAIPVARCIREVALNQDMKALTSKGRLALDYFILFVRGCEKRLLRVWTKQGATVESVEHQYLANTKVPIPPPPEQLHIVEQLAFETAPQTTAISRLEREIDLLREYRTRLVADVVTGKLDVREAAARLPDEGPLETVEDDADLADDTEDAVEKVAA